MSWLTTRALLAASAVAIVYALYWGRDVLVPMALAVLLSFMLSPAVARLERWRLGRVASVLSVVLLAFSLLAGVGWIVADQMVDLAAKMPEYKDNIQQKIQQVKTAAGSTLSDATQAFRELGQEINAIPPAAEPAPGDNNGVVPGQDAGHVPDRARAPPEAAGDQKPIPVQVVSTPGNVLQFIIGTITAILGPLGTAGIVVVLVIFMLLGREDLRDRVIRLTGRRQINLTTQALNDAGARISRYLVMQLIVNVTYGIPIAVGLYFIGVPNAILWGLLTMVLRFLPYLGPWIGAVIPIMLSLASPGWTQPLLTIGLFVVMEVISNNFIETWLYGSTTGISSVAVLFAAVFWTWLWGPMGLLLSTPLTVLMVVLGKYVPQFEFFTILLGDQPALPPPARLYQRLLAEDFEEGVQELAEEFTSEKPLVEVYDAILVPVLRMAAEDVNAERLNEAKLEEIHETIHELVEHLEAAPNGEENPVPLPDADTEAVPVLCLPARDEADEIAAAMLARVLQRQGLNAEALSVDRLASEMLDDATGQGARIICVVGLPPRPASHARYLCKRIHTRFHDAVVVLALLSARLPHGPARERLGCSGEDKLVDSIAAAVREIQSLSAVMAKRSEPPQRLPAAGRAESRRAARAELPKTEERGTPAPEKRRTIENLHLKWNSYSLSVKWWLVMSMRLLR
jgi:predicted PurR-regulated permease PerM